MIDSNPALLTHAQLLDIPSVEREARVEAWLLASIQNLRQDTAAAFDAASSLADLSIDSIQVVELKFGLDQLIGKELDIEIIISNPTIRELAASSLRAGGL